MSGVDLEPQFGQQAGRELAGVDAPGLESAHRRRVQPQGPELLGADAVIEPVQQGVDAAQFDQNAADVE